MILDQTVYHRHILVFQSSFNRLYARSDSPLPLPAKKKWTITSFVLTTRLANGHQIYLFRCYRFGLVEQKKHTQNDLCALLNTLLYNTIWHAWHTITIHQSIQNFWFTRRHLIFVLCFSFNTFLTFVFLPTETTEEKKSTIFCTSRLIDLCDSPTKSKCVRTIFNNMLTGS